MSKKTGFIGIRVTSEQKAVLEDMAKNNNQTVSDYIKSVLSDNTSDIKLTEVKESESEVGFARIDLSLNKEQEQKVIKIAEELGASKQEAIRRMINEGNIFDLRVNIDLDNEFKNLTSEITRLNKLVSGIYTLCKRTDGVLTKHEVEHLYEVMHEVSDNTGKIIATVYTTSNQVKIMARKRMDKLIKDASKKVG